MQPRSPESQENPPEIIVPPTPTEGVRAPTTGMLRIRYNTLSVCHAA